MHTCMIWSSFLIESRLGPERLPSPPSARFVSSGLVDSDEALVCPPKPCLELFVLVGFVWGEEAGDDTLGGCLGC